MIAALFVASNGPYFSIDGIDPWDEVRDAKKYLGPHRIVAHPPCERWGRYWSGGPSAKVRRILGDDNGCFESALNSVRKWGGVVEHPEASHAFKVNGLGIPPRKGGWIRNSDGWICCVEQGHYGHPGRKATWLYVRSAKKPMELKWGPSQGMRLDEGFHSNDARARARAAGIKPAERLSKNQRLFTPLPFAYLLCCLAQEAVL